MSRKWCCLHRLSQTWQVWRACFSLQNNVVQLTSLAMSSSIVQWQVVSKTEAAALEDLQDGLCNVPIMVDPALAGAADCCISTAKKTMVYSI